MEERFKEWLSDGNVIVIDGYFTTQCSLYTNRFKTMKQLYQYFKKEYC
jgi:hypothetical protein